MIAAERGVLLPYDVPQDAPQLAAYLNDNDLPGARGAREIRALRAERSRRRTTASTPSLHDRLNAMLLNQARTEIIRQGGEAVITGRVTTSELTFWDRDPRQRLTLVGARGPRYYPDSHGDRPAVLVYLCGTGAPGPWVARVAPSVSSVAQALAWLEPRDVREARERDRHVERFGEVYAVETTSQYDTTGNLPPTYHWNTDTRTLTYKLPSREPHSLQIPWPVRFLSQRVYQPSHRKRH